MSEAQRTWQLRAWLYLYSNANIFGCALALLGPALLFGGWIAQGWLLITGGLYAAGWALGWGLRAPPEIERSIAASLSMDEILERMDTLVRQVQSHLSAEMNVHLQSVRSSVAEVLPRLIGTSGFDNDLYTVRETVLRYLPETLANYVALPPAFRTTHLLRDGKTARQLLSDQLSLLDAQMKEVVANVLSADAQALVANGKFLEQKFQQPDFLAP